MLVGKVAAGTGTAAVTALRRVRVPCAFIPARTMTSTVWSEMPMGPPDPILGLTGALVALHLTWLLLHKMEVQFIGTESFPCCLGSL